MHVIPVVSTVYILSIILPDKRFPFEIGLQKHQVNSILGKNRGCDSVSMEIVLNAFEIPIAC